MENKKITNVLAIIGFIVSLISIFTVGFPSAVGLTLSIIALVISKKYFKPYKGLAIAGIVISAIMFIVFWIMTIISLNSPAIPDDYTSPSPSVKPSTSTTIKKPKKIVVADFSTMTSDEAKTWCKTIGADCNISSDYNDGVEYGKLISQSIEANQEIESTESINVLYSLGHKETLGETNAVKKAKDYIRVMAFSRDGLIKQLEFEGYSNAEATYGVDRCGADWNEQAAKKAKDYLNVMAFSRDGLISQLEFEGFTYEQAVYGVTQNGY